MAPRAVLGTPAAGLADNVFSPVEPFDVDVVSRVSIYSRDARPNACLPHDTLTPSSGVVKRLRDGYLPIHPFHTGGFARKGIDSNQN
jgi:hypothetical protein